jgi:Beta-galactosidase/beta-glucuronidase
MNRSRLIAAFAAVLLVFVPAAAQIRGFHQTILKDWEFSKDGSSWEEIKVPHCYNAVDGHSPRYYRGEATYRRQIRISNDMVDHYLLFEGAAQACVVKVNGQTVATHKGGYTPFTVNITDAVKKGTNDLEVICDNREDLDLAPVTSDFNKNGGLHADVWQLDMEDIYFSPEEYGQFRLRVETPEVTERKVVTNVRTKIVNSSGKETKVLVRVQLLEPDGVLAYQADREFFVRAYSDYDFDHDFYLKGLHLWNGVKDPYLYTVRVEVFKGKRMMDIADTKIGYRNYSLDPEWGFLLNGRPYPLRGVAMHQDTDGKALAMDVSDFRRDYRIVKELGANFLRLAHYPHNDVAFQLCDSLGIIVQTEVPWVNICGKNARQSYFNNIQHQMKEMISNLYNHPSIIFWGMWNELDEWGNKDDIQGPLDTDKVAAETEKLYDFAKSLDPDRLVGFTDDSRLARSGYANLKCDYCSQNLYYGWYYTPNEFTGFSEALANVRASKKEPINVAEYGVGINPFCHTWDASQAVRNKEDDTRHFEEYGNLFHESYVRQIAKMPWLGFTSAWVLFDFPVASRMEGFMDSSDGVNFTPSSSRKFMNDKGLVTRDRQTKKDVFYLYKSLWNKDETTVCITGRRLAGWPVDKALRVKVYSNAKTLTLYQNGKIVTKLYSSGESSGVIWVFPEVRLKTGQDTFKVVANDGTTDEVTLSRL